MTSPAPAKTIQLWVIRLLSVAALSVCFWLYQRKLSGDISSIVGCGGEGDCAQVMGGVWSEWFHLPVTLLAGLVYAAIFCLTLPRTQQILGRAGDQLLAAGGVILAAAAAYFLSILYLVEKAHCPWCLGLHITGMTVAGLILTCCRGQGVMGAAGLTGFAAMVILATGQIWGPKPQTFLITADSTDAPAAPEVTTGPRVISFFDGSLNLKYDASALPLLGSPSAKVVLVEFFDYTCGSCRELAGDLRELKKKWPDTFAVIALPAPLNRACNSWLKENVRDHPGACELAKLSLALWKAKPGAFSEFHDYLLSLPLPITPEKIAAAKKRAENLAGATELAAAIDDPWVTSQLTENLTTFAKLTTQSIVMPKLLLHSSVMMHGTARDTAEFLQTMEQQFALKGK